MSKGVEMPDTNPKPSNPIPGRSPRKFLPLLCAVALVLLAVVIARGIFSRVHAETTLARATETSAIPNVLVTHPKAGTTGEELVLPGNMEAFTASNEPPAGSPDYFGSGYTDASGAYWQEINLQALSQQPQFLSISA